MMMMMMMMLMMMMMMLFFRGRGGVAVLNESTIQQTP